VSVLYHVSGRAKLDELDIRQAFANCAVDGNPEVLVVLAMVDWLIFAGPRLALEKLGAESGLVTVNDGFPFRDDVAKHYCKGSPLLEVPLSICNCLLEDGLSSSEADVVLLVEAPQCIGGNGAIEGRQL